MKYVSNYKEEKTKVVRKVEHSLRVYESSMDYARELGWSKREVETAGIIGLLHDYGRFEQVKVTGEMQNVETFDHGDFGVKLLFEEGHIKNYTKDESLYPAIEFAIKNHNKLTLEDNKDPDAMKFAKLIRDADKVDIIYFLGKLGIYDEHADESAISDEVLDSIMQRSVIRREDIKTNNDKLALRFALAFDLNYDVVLEDFKKNIEIYYARVEREDRFKVIYETIIDYLNERIDKRC